MAMCCLTLRNPANLVSSNNLMIACKTVCLLSAPSLTLSSHKSLLLLPNHLFVLIHQCQVVFPLIFLWSLHPNSPLTICTQVFHTLHTLKYSALADTSLLSQCYPPYSPPLRPKRGLISRCGASLPMFTDAAFQNHQVPKAVGATRSASHDAGAALIRRSFREARKCLCGTNWPKWGVFIWEASRQPHPTPTIQT